MLSELSAISPIDGRYRHIAEPLAEHLSEYALIRARIRVECEYLIALSKTPGLPMRKLSRREEALLRRMGEVSIADARIVKQIERKGYKGIPATNHDLKATEYLIKEKLKKTSLRNVLEWVHFALTSEDVDNLAQALLLRDAIEQIIAPAIKGVREHLDKLANVHAKTAMLARTHGQPASPTTFGKEIRVFEARLARQLQQLHSRSILVKWAGATGNYNAHMAGAPKVNWPAFSKKFVARFNDRDYSIAFELNPTATQIEPHDTYAELFDNLRRINVILIGFSQNIWRYVSDGWIAQKPKAGEVGSSTMPHKVNPIDFENAEGNFGIANALFEHFSNKLPITRLQRDLSDSTVERNFGSAFAHALIGYRALLRGLEKISINKNAMRDALNAHPEVLAEAIQTVLRREGATGAYEKLKEVTRGKDVTLEDLRVFIKTLEISKSAKSELLALTPENYTGLAATLANLK